MLNHECSTVANQNVACVIGRKCTSSKNGQMMSREDA